MQRGVLATVCVLVIGLYAYMAQSSLLELLTPSAADAHYNLLVRGLRAGQLNLKTDVPTGLAQLADPYDPTANAPYRDMPYRLHDLSFYKGRLYLYFGVTPAVMLFWPYAALTGQYLFHRQAVAIFCTIGFLASVGLLYALWRRYFVEVRVGVVVACVLALGLATGVPVLLPQSGIYEVAISCGYVLTMLTLGAIWCAMHESRKRSGWLAAASLAYGLAVGARPSLLFGAVVLLVPVAQAWRERRPIGGVLAAAVGPITLVGLGLMLYNFLRFDNPLEFGQHYELSVKRQVLQQFFSLRYLWFNFRVYFLEPARWSGRFPFVHEATLPPLPAGYGLVEHPFGVLTNIPLVWLALAAPLAWRGRSGQAWSVLRWFVATVALFFGVCALTVGLFWSAIARYEVDFLPALVLLAVISILSLARTLSDRPVWQRTAQWCWSLLLAFSVAFNLLASVKECAEWHCELGPLLVRQGKVQEAIEQYKQALRLTPDYAQAHYNLAVTLQGAGQVQEAIGHYEQALRLKPDYALAHYNLGNALLRIGQVREAIGHYEQALQINPDYAAAHNNLGAALVGQGRLPEAIGHYEQALRLTPDYAQAHYKLGLALEQAGEIQEAIAHYEQALRLQPDYAEAHNNLGAALMTQGRLPEAIGHYEQSLQINPQNAEAQYNLGIALVQVGRLPEAIEHWEQALRLKPNNVDAHYNLGVALEKLGRTQEAIQHYEQALRIKPDFTEAQKALARLQAGQ